MSESNPNPEAPAPKAFVRRAWMEALQEMESHGGASAQRPAPAPAPAPGPKPSSPSAQPAAATPIHLCLQSIVKAEASAEAFVKAHPYLMAPNIVNLWLDNLKETRLILERQLRRPAGEA